MLLWPQSEKLHIRKRTFDNVREAWPSDLGQIVGRNKPKVTVPTNPLPIATASERRNARQVQAKCDRSGLAQSVFSTVCIDDDPERLAETYRLRYQTYCVEQAFLGASDYPDGLETDDFDLFSRHFATVDNDGRTVATIRLVLPSVLGLPLFRHCTLFPGETAIYDPRSAVVEISRLSVSRPYRPSAFGSGALFNLYKAVYHDAKRRGMTHWAIATEASLHRTLTAAGFPFRRIGPDIDYWGPVAPYLLDLSELDRILVAGTAPRLDGFLDGLDPPYRPGPHEAGP